MTKKQQKLEELLTCELLSEVLGLEVKEIWTSSKQNSLLSNEIAYMYGDRGKKKLLNLDTLTRKMKEWCLETVSSEFNDINSGKSEYKVKRFNRLTEREKSNHKYYCELVVENSGATIFKTGNSELEAVAKATQWVYNQVKGK